MDEGGTASPLAQMLGRNCVVGVDAGGAAWAEVLQHLDGFELLLECQPAFVELAPEVPVPTTEATLIAEHLPESGTTAGRYRLHALTAPQAPAQRELLKARLEAFCASADIVVVRTGSPETVEPGFATLRMALARGKPVIWLDDGVQPPARRLSIASTKAGPSYAERVEALLHLRDTDLVAEWRRALEALFEAVETPFADWCRERVLPVLDAACAFRCIEHDGHAHASHEPSAAAIFERIWRLSFRTSERQRLSDRSAGLVNFLLSRLIVYALQPGALWNACRRGFAVMFQGGSLTATERRFDTALASIDIQLDRSNRLGRAFEAADERALIDSGRYRSAVWLGYLASIFAVLAAAMGLMNAPDSLHATSVAVPTLASPSASLAESVGAAHGEVVHHQSAALWAWAFALPSLSLLALSYQWLARNLRQRKSIHLNDRGVVYVALFSVVVAAVGGAFFVDELGLAPVVEVFMLSSIVALVSVVWSFNAHESWLAARALAEAIRYDRMLLPGLALNRSSRQSSLRIGRQGPVMADAVSWWLARARAPLPLPRSAQTSRVSLCNRDYLRSYIAYLTTLLQEQAAYHDTRHERENSLHHRIHLLTGVFFVLAAICTLGHVLSHGSEFALYLAYGTIGLPVFAAGLHAINGHLEAARHASASLNMSRALKRMTTELDAIGHTLAAGAQEGSTVEWAQVARIQRIAGQATDAMMADVSAWYRLVAAQPVTVPS
jgi:hypothetical protein